MAVERLALVAEVFGETSRKLMVESVPAGAETVLSRLRAWTHHPADRRGVRPRRVIGVDATAAYVGRARRLIVDPRVDSRSRT